MTLVKAATPRSLPSRSGTALQRLFGSTLDRYVLREVALPFGIGIGLFFVVISFGQMLKISDSLTGLIGAFDIVQALIYTLPPLMGLLIPASALFATLLGIGRIAADREVIGMTAAGVSPYRLLRVPFATGALLACFSAYFLIVGEPWGVRGIRDLMSHGAQSALASGVRPGEFHQWIPGVTFMAAGKKRGELIDVVFADQRDPDKSLFISARRGIVAGGDHARDLVFDLKDGVVLLDDKQNDGFRVIQFERTRYRLDVNKLVGNAAKTVKRDQEKSLLELWEEHKDPHNKAGARALYTILLHRKMALPFATIIFSLLAVPLACRATGGARARGFLYSAGIIGAYYYLGRAVELLARDQRYPAALAAWTPNLIGLIALAVLLVRMKRSAA